VLDEPTNDLDLGALRALEEALLAFQGSALIVSHDRWFLDRVATLILCLDGAGGVRLHRGDVSTLLADLARERAERRAAEAAAARPAPAAESRPAAKSRRITPWQQKELAALEARIGTLEGELAALDARLADPALWTGARSDALAVQAERARVAGELAASFARWEELESLR
jgi:ATP-binding cassette subfamily F protein uup